ncbi:hypothetical protein JW868_02950 [Candidatus Woesearchaeota archaeon]|nr:hypothetical protein [Candidatus Woesearchaeota archaeon]
MSTFWLITLSVFVGLSYVISWLMYRKIVRTRHELRAMLAEVNLNSKIADTFSHNIDQHNISSLANNLVKKLKSKYGMRSTSYSDLVMEIRHSREISDDLREALIDFFEHLVLISYKEETISDQERVDLKRKLKMIIKLFQNK